MEIGQEQAPSLEQAGEQQVADSGPNQTETDGSLADVIDTLDLGNKKSEFCYERDSIDSLG